MCTAATYKTKDHYFGRNFDLEYSYSETVTVTPRNYPLRFRYLGELKQHYAMIGVAYVFKDYPLYYDATNEKGLSMAGLNFPGNADYKDVVPDKDNVAIFELMPWLLGRCATVEEVREQLGRLNIIKEGFSAELPASPLHWIIADREKSIVLESVKEGLKVYDNPVGVLTNNPPFDYHLHNLANYMTLSAEAPVNSFADGVELKAYSRGMGAMSLPGDLSSASRFIKAAFTRCNARSGEGEMESVSQFFHILGSVEQQRGCVHMGKGEYEITLYSSCCNTDKGIYYYVTYDNRSISAVDMHRCDLDGAQLMSWPLRKEQDVFFQN